jgi:hypothetical protein
VLPDTFAVRIQVVLNSRLIADNKKNIFSLVQPTGSLLASNAAPYLPLKKR